MSSRVNRSGLLVLVLPAAIAAGACSDSAGNAVNRPPVPTTPAVTTDEDVPVAIPVLDGVADPDGDPLTVVRPQATGHRVDLLAGGVLMVTPAQDFHGQINVTYAVSDGFHEVASSATVTVRSVDDAPVAIGGTQDVHGNAAVMLHGSDIEGDALTYEVTDLPTHGNLTGAPPLLRYSPDIGFVGEDTLTFTVHDASLASAPATLHLEVSPGSMPVAVSEAVSGNEDQRLDFVLHASDPDGDPLPLVFTTGNPHHGTLSVSGPNASYLPDHDFNGDDSFEFSVSNGYTSSDIATITIHVASVNDAPVALAQDVAGTEDTTSTITLHGSDVEGAALTFHVGQAGNGTVTLSGATATYTPAANFHGSDHFTFTVSDGAATSAPATVSIEVASVNDPPVAGAVSQNLSEDVPVAVTLQGSDADGDPITYTIERGPDHGSLGGDPPRLKYFPDANFNGTDSFTYTVSDGVATSAAATVTLQVAPVNDPPVAFNSTVTTAEDTRVTITLQASDVDGDPLTFSPRSFPSDGTLTTSNGATWTYVPAPDVNGIRSFDFSVFDGHVSASATVKIEITPVNDPPSTRDDFVATDPGTPIAFNVTGNDLDIEGDTLTLDSVDAPAHGTAEIVDGQVRYTPDAGFTGVEVFGYTITDGNGGSARGNAHVGVDMFPPGAPNEVVSALGNTIAFGAQVAPAISGNDRYVAFVTGLALVSDDTNAVQDVYVYDRGTRMVTRASVTSTGGQGNSASLRPRLSASGRYVVFESFATNLVAGDTNGVSDVFRHDRVTGETVRVSVATGGGQASGGSIDAQISDDGNVVAFTSSAFDLVANDANGAQDIFVRDLVAGTTDRISVSVINSDGDQDSTEPALSGDGRYVAFSSLATNLVTGDTNNLADIFVRDRVAGATTRVSVSSTGVQADRRSFGASVSRDGRFVSFVSSATNLVPPGGGGLPYVRDLQAQTTTSPPVLLSLSSAELSGDGRYLTGANTFSGNVVCDRFAATSRPLSSSAWSWPVLSGSGRYIVALDSTSGGRVVVAPNPL